MNDFTTVARPTIIAQPLEEHTWRVWSMDSDDADLDRTVGYIEELGGTYEVRMLLGTTRYVPDFKSAMECFGVGGQVG